MNRVLKKVDKILFNLLEKEFKRQKYGLELIASENFTSKGVFECVGSVLLNKYSEGQPGSRYYGGCQVIDEIETLCKHRALKAYRLAKEKWGVNVQPYSGSPANMAVYNAILSPHDRIMGLDLPSGGHLTHGYYTNKKKISATSVFYESLPYKIKEDGFIDYDNLEEMARVFKPKLIICGASAYPRDLDYKRFRKIANINNSYLMCDMAHISGLVVAQELSSPFDYCDVVTTTTHKTLRGPRSGMIFFKKELEDAINFSVFPGLQGGPHNNQIAGLALQLLEADSEDFRDYIRQIKLNARCMSRYFIEKGYKLVTDGTDTHIVLIDLKNKSISGAKAEYICEKVDISLNKNSVFGDTSATNPGGIRIGTAALTTRGLNEKDFETVSSLIDECLLLCQTIQVKSGRKLTDFKQFVDTDRSTIEYIQTLKNKVNTFAGQFVFYDSDL